MSQKTRRRIWAAAMLVVSIICVGSSLQSTTLQRMSLNQLARTADAVVRARCLGTTARWENGAIWTLSEFELVERFQGSPPSRIQIRLPGGRVGAVTTRVEDVPQFRAGEESVLFLEARLDGTYAVTAWVEGTFRIRRAPADGREFVTQDSASIAVFDPATRQFRNEGVRNVPWNDFRQRLAGALSAAQRGGSR